MGKKAVQKPLCRVLLADGNRGQLNILQEYAQGDPSLEICGTVTNAEALLLTLRSAGQIDVVVLDEYLRGEDILTLLSRIAALQLPGCPRLIVTTLSQSEERRQCLLAAGADVVLCKPYHLDALFENLIPLSKSSEEYRHSRVRKRIARYLYDMRIERANNGYWLLASALERLVFAKHSCSSTKELYPETAKELMLSHKAVESGIRRAVDEAYKARSEVYRELCEGADEKRALSNTTFLNRLAQRISLELDIT